MISKISFFVLIFVLLRNPRKSIFAFTLFVGIHIPLANHVHAEIKKNSCLDDSSIKDEQDKVFPMYENLPKDNTSGKTRNTDASKNDCPE